MEFNWNQIKTLEDLKKVVQANVIGKAPDYSISRNPSGTTIKIDWGKAWGNGNYQPWDIIVTTSGSAVTSTVYPGTLNSLIPSNMWDSASFTTSDTRYFKVIGTTDGSKVTSCVIEIDDAQIEPQTPVLNALPATFEICFGLVYGGTAYRTIGDGSITATGHLEYSPEKDSPADPGETTRDYYYVWEFGTI